MRILLFTITLACLVTPVLAQDVVPSHEALQDDVPLASYLDALAQISPAAREGAQVFMAAFEARCGRSLKTIELRRAVADGGGAPVLMAMMRAAAQHDSATLQRLSNSVSCAGGV